MLGGESTKGWLEGGQAQPFFSPFTGGGEEGLSPQAPICTPLHSQAALDSAAVQEGQPLLQKGGDIAPPPALHRWAAASLLLRAHRLGPPPSLEEEEESQGAIFQSPPCPQPCVGIVFSAT